MRSTIIVYCVFIILIIYAPALVFSDGTRIVSFPWSTSFDCTEWTRDEADPNYSRPLVCSDDEDALNEGLANSVQGGCGSPSKWTQITSAANYSGGDGGRGQRTWYTYITDGSNESTGGFVIKPPIDEPEIWFRWYIRYTPGDEAMWTTIGYDKLIYIEMYPTSSSADLVMQWYGSDSFRFGKQSIPGDMDVASVGWATTMGNSNYESDGEWHYIEFHLKIDTDGSNGIVELWIDDDQTPVYSNTAADLGGLSTSLTGFNEILLISNQEYIKSGACIAVDIDDISISATSQIGQFGESSSSVSMKAGNTGAIKPGSTGSFGN